MRQTGKKWARERPPHKWHMRKGCPGLSANRNTLGDQMDLVAYEQFGLCLAACGLLSASLLCCKLKQLMVVGIDCYHDTTAGRRSIAGFVASLNQGMTR